MKNKCLFHKWKKYRDPISKEQMRVCQKCGYEQTNYFDSGWGKTNLDNSIQQAIELAKPGDYYE